MINIKGADDNSASKLGLESLTEEEATLFLKLVKLCKKPQGANIVQQMASETPTTSESSSHNVSASEIESAEASAFSPKASVNTTNNSLSNQGTNEASSFLSACVLDSNLKMQDVEPDCFDQSSDATSQASA